MITILAIGKTHEPWIRSGLERYQKRLKKPFTVEWVLLPHSSKSGLQARQEETERILARINPRDFVILLDERGKILDSPGVAEMLQAGFMKNSNIVLVIGGAYGVSDRLYDGSGASRADAVWSLSKLVFPHQLVRLIAVEQLYRAQEINRSSGYHHE